MNRAGYPNTTNLAVLGTQHLNDHIRPAYIKHLKDGVEEGMRAGLPFKVAFSRTARQLTREHERFLLHSIPYGIDQLKAKGILGWLPIPGGHVGLIQANARAMRFSAALEVLGDYSRRHLVSASEAFALVHETD